jgi:hypothetical protein
MRQETVTPMPLLHDLLPYLEIATERRPVLDGCRLVVTLACLLPLGCVMPTEPGPLTCLPTETITPATLGRLTRVGAWKVSSLDPLEGIVRERSAKIDDAAMDSDRGILYVQYREHPLGRAEHAGIYGYNLVTGKCVVRSPFPARSDMTGQLFYFMALTRSVFDFDRQVAYVSDMFDHVNALVQLSLTGQAPRLLIQSEFRLAKNPTLGNGRLLMEARHVEAGGNKRLQIMALDPVSLEQVGPYDIKGNWVELPMVVGGHQDYVVIHDFVHDEVIVYRMGADALVEVARKGHIARCWSVSPHCMPTHVEPWLIVVPSGCSIQQRIRESAGTVYVLPDLQNGVRLEGSGAQEREYAPRSAPTVAVPYACIPSSTLLDFGAGDDHVFFDGLTGRRVGAIRFGQLPIESYDARVGISFTDQHGLYLGVFGSHWIQLFGTCPNVGSSRRPGVSMSSCTSVVAVHTKGINERAIR